MEEKSGPIRYKIGDQVTPRSDLDEAVCNEFKLRKGKTYEVEGEKDEQGEQWITVDAGTGWDVSLASSWFELVPKLVAVS